MIDWFSLLLKACTLSSTGIAKLLLKSVEDKLGEAGLRSFLEQEDTARNTALMVCVDQSELSMRLTDQSQVCVESGAGESAVTLLGAGARASTSNRHGQTPLHVAATHGLVDIAKVMTCRVM